MWFQAATPPTETETVLDDFYPVYGDYWYLVDGRVEISDVFGTVGWLRQDIISQGRTANEVRRCDNVLRSDQEMERRGLSYESVSRPLQTSARIMLNGARKKNSNKPKPSNRFVVPTEPVEWWKFPTKARYKDG